MNRREFLVNTALAAAALPTVPAFSAVAGSPGRDKLIGIQIPAVSFVDEGVEAVLDNVQRLAAVNTIFITVLAFNDGLAGRQLKGFPFPDHGKKIYLGDDGFKGGYYATLHPKFHKSPLYEAFRSPDLPGFDVLKEVIPAARKRGLKTYVFFADNIRHGVKAFENLVERSRTGQPRGEVCMNNESYREVLFGLLADCLTSYDVDGLLYRSERIGPLSKTMGLTHLGFSEPTCFCEHCQRLGRAQGINLARVQEGYEKLEGFVAQSRAGKRPNDGFHVTFLRLLLRYPEILQWQTFQTDSLQRMYRDVYAFVKKDRPRTQVGWAIAVNNGLNPFYRAEQDWPAMAPYSDFLKVTMYESVIGNRMAKYIENATMAWYGDLTPEQMLELEYAIMGYNQPGFSELTTKGFSSEYITNETRRIRTGLGDAPTQVLAGIDVDLPSAGNERNLGAAGLKTSVEAALRGGSDGIILSRKYSEMNLKTLSGAGEAVRTWRG
ncbi:hypothetical protein [Tellurirhabdus rosea]|uniref:hypothetical protein n=1 Tax=Tellurirhabdus rosea TaxID=2674997 RepID=UPI0022587878|nr:hypothetical protein [Tellurirhabdus rosea]